MHLRHPQVVLMTFSRMQRPYHIHGYQLIQNIVDEEWCTKSSDRVVLEQLLIKSWNMLNIFKR